MTAARDVSALKSRYLEILPSAATVVLSYRPLASLSLGLPAREHRIHHAVKLELWRAKPVKRENHGGRIIAEFPISHTDQLFRLVARIDKMLDTLAAEPLLPKMVEVILEVSSRERSRWTKDGRLPKSGTGTFKRGQVIRYYTHPVAEILELAAHPEIIERWRREDATSGQ